MFLKDMVHDGYYPNLVVDPAWFDDKHPQESLPTVEDPVALWRPAPERDKIGSTLRFGQSFGGLPNISMGFDLNDPTLLLEVGPVTLENEASASPLVSTGTIDLDLTGLVEDGYFIFFLLWHRELDFGTIRFTPGEDQQILFNNEETQTTEMLTIMGISGYYKFWNTGDDLIYTWEPSSNNLGQFYIHAWIYSNVNEAQPIDNFTFGLANDRDQRHTGTLLYNGDWFGSALRIQSTNSAAFEAWFYGNTGRDDGLPTGTFVGTKKDPYTPEGAVDQVVNDRVPGQRGWILARSYPGSAIGVIDEGTNLLKYTAPGEINLTNWTNQDGGSGLTIGQPDLSGSLYTELRAPNNSFSFKLGISQSVTLTQGVEYCYQIGVWNFNEPINNYKFYGYEDTTGTIKGTYLEQKNATITNDESRDVNSPWSSPFINRSTCVNSNNGVEKPGSMLYFFFTPDITGTYKMMINIAGPPGVGIASADIDYVSSINQVAKIDYVSLYVGTDIRNPVLTKATAVTTPSTTIPGVMNRMYVRSSLLTISNKAMRTFSMEICGKTVTQTRLMEQSGGSEGLGGMPTDIDGLGAGNDFGSEGFAFPLENHPSIVGRMVYPAGQTVGSTGKYYAEIQWGITISPPMSAGAWHCAVYLNAPGGNNPGFISGRLPGYFSLSNKETGIAYAADGKIYHGGSTFTETAWPDNNTTIGVAINFVDGECTFYLNGVAQPTVTLDPIFLARPTQIGCMPVVNFVNYVECPFRIATVSADFIETKPSGFQDWDWASQ